MKWTKRLKWLRLSKVIIPIALAISIVFAGFAVFADEAENFVIRIDKGNGVNLAISLNEDLSEQTSYLQVPVPTSYTDVTWTPDENCLYEKGSYYKNLPDDIAYQEGITPVYYNSGSLAFFAFSFYLINVSSVSAEVEITATIDGMVTGTNSSDYHVDGAVRFMLIEGKHLLSENSNTVIYKKAESSEENAAWLTEEGHIAYGNYPIRNFVTDTCILRRTRDTYDDITLSALQDGDGTCNGSNVQRFTVVIWLEGWDTECIDAILPETLKMSMSFTAV